MQAKCLNKKWVICFLFILISLSAALYLYQIGHDKIIFKANGEALSHGKLECIGSFKFEDEYTLNERGAVNFGWTLFTEKKQLFCKLDDAQGNRIVNTVLDIPVHGVRIYDFHNNKTIVTTSHFDFGFFNYQTEVEQVDLPDDIETDVEKSENN